MNRILCPGVLCLLLSTAVPISAGMVVWDFGAPAGADRNKNLPAPRPAVFTFQCGGYPMSPGSGRSDADRLRVIIPDVGAPQNRLCSMHWQSFRDPQWNSTSQSLV